jgi:hypothetical protein
MLAYAAPQPKTLAKAAPSPVQVTKPAAKPVEEVFDDYPKDAQACFRLGYKAYKECSYAVARAYFNQAVRLNEQDARFWYFKAFTELAMENRPLALASAKRAEQLRARGLPAAPQIDQAFAQLPTSARQFLAEVRPPDAKTNIVAAR